MITNKRLKIEEKIWDKSFNNYNQYLGVHNLDGVYKIYLHIKKINNEKNIFFCIDDFDNYPWQHPNLKQIVLKNKKKMFIPYNYFINDFNDIELNEFKLITKYNCLCCQSILCGNNWGPTLTIIDIVNEIKHFFNVKQRVKERITFKFI